MFNSISNSRETKSSRIAAKLEEQILSKKLSTGDFLPSQQELADQFGASSRSIREAFKQLEAKGLLTISQGRRAQVKSNNLDQFVESLSTSIIRNHSSNKKLIFDLVDVRTTLTLSATREFSRMPDRQATVKGLKKLTDQMFTLLPMIQQRDSAAVENFQDLDSQFNRELIKSNNNTILNAIYDNLLPLLETNIRKLKYSYRQMEKKIQEYTYICEALQNGQTDLAVALVLVTLTSLRQKVEEKFEADSL